MAAYLTLLLENLKRRLDEKPPPVILIEIAKGILSRFRRDELPDWIEILANGNPNHIEAVVETAKADIQAEEVLNGHDG